MDSLKNRIQSFSHAFRGLRSALRKEPNLQIHATVSILVCALGIWAQLHRWEWIAQFLAMGLVWSAELMNTVWEEFLNFQHPASHPRVGLMKDIAAAAVLVAAMAATGVGLLLYIPRVWAWLQPIITQG